MHSYKDLLRLLAGDVILVLSLVLSSCSTNNDNSYTTATTVVAPPPRQVLRVVPKPREIFDLENERDGGSTSMPVLKILFPPNGTTISNSTVPVRISLTDNLKPSAVYDDKIALTLDNEPYVAGYPYHLRPQVAKLFGPFELRNVVKGRHLLRAFVLKPTLETYKNEDALRMTTFTIAADSNDTKPTVTSAGEVIADERQPTGQFVGGQLEVDTAKPLLTFALPGGMNLTPDVSLVIDFYLSNAKLKGDGGEYRVRYIIDDDDPQWIDKWEPVWLAGWIEGKHTVRLELIGPDGWPFLNGGYNIITREISVVNH
jgi:hypothetical protein